jgi:NADPH2:quinone reductase
VGVVERSTADASARGLVEGSRVAASLPRMGAHATSIDVPARLLVPVPDALDSEVAAALPLDLVTAGLAWSLAGVPAGGSVLVQGASGPVGGLLVQLASAGGHPVLGTSSASTRAVTESLGATWLDYRDPTWVDRVLEEVPHGVAAAFDHTGSASLRPVVTADGTLVRLSFVGRRGHERLDTFTGSVRALARTLGRPRERVVSVPLFVALRPAAYRAMLADQLERVANGALAASEVEVVPMADAAQAHARLEAGLAGRKLVLAT